MPQPQPDLFAVEAEGLRVLREQGGMQTAAVRQVTPELLILAELCPRPGGRPFWEQLGRQLATLHTSTTSDRFGWHQNDWLGRLRQHNSWNQDGHAFFAQHRILRWLPERWCPGRSTGLIHRRCRTIGSAWAWQGDGAVPGY